MPIPPSSVSTRFYSRDTDTMHRALCISEILREVLIYASQQCIRDATSQRVCTWHACGDELSHCSTSCAYNTETHTRPTPRHMFLLAVVLSCKTFSSVALDLLWRVLDSPEPLRRLMKCYNISDVEDDAFQTCTRYRAYANRVKGIHSGGDVSHYRDAARRAGARTKQFFTLPRLRSVRIDVTSSSKYQRPFGLLTNALTDVCLSFVGNSRHWCRARASSYVDNYLQSLTKQPFLNTLELDWIPLVPDPALLIGLPMLRTLRVALLANVVEAIPFLHVLHKSRVSDVRVFIEQEDCDIPVVDYHRTSVGGSVELYLSGNPSALCLDRLMGIFPEGERATELHLACEFECPNNRAFAESPLSSPAVDALCRALRCERSTAAVALRAPPDLTRSSSDGWFTFAAIQPLLRLRCMTRFEVSANVRFELSDANMDALARAWPDLEALELRLYHDSLQGRGVLPTTCPTFRSLVSLGRHCRRLCEVHLPFRADLDDLSCEEWSAPHEANRSVRWLTVDGGEVLCSEGKVVGMALQRIFPCATLDTHNVFDMVTWDGIIQAKLRSKLNTDMYRHSI
ncbi:uncharacterized protein C8Q71DRAFT_137953 [Rhodofomes roseus]|uniref:F-box domain-containing protein n=1 Tax=Rhodofomes roseus TaxID=34475 RepID=A0ABQ8KBU3_9APHY|nr:uncharacterized protein C8Q71DRAFT_137953 [Rhodofomes roseus]KAH9835028.1 hypothetical protein C8Q71DRAFT_137953 [Rhodofomes roseus]